MCNQKIAFLLLALWWGSLTTVGFMVVPLLFVHMDSMQAAGKMAAILFSAQNYVGWIFGFILTLIYKRNKHVDQLGRAQVALYFIAVALLASLISHWLIAPQIIAKSNLKLWHSIGTALYLCQWICVTVLVFYKATNPTHERLLKFHSGSI